MSAPSNNQEKIVLKVSGMSCKHCVQHVEKALQQSEGVISARVDLDVEKAYVSFDPAALSEETVLQVIRDTGYEAALSEQ